MPAEWFQWLVIAGVLFVAGVALCSLGGVSRAPTYGWLHPMSIAVRLGSCFLEEEEIVEQCVELGIKRVWMHCMMRVVMRTLGFLRVNANGTGPGANGS
ncbi:MAG: hypothetical protein RRC07_09380 [Anaerolineae bacterium]|nr:hypothetical protein [Anaerolineae bacterium]